MTSTINRARILAGSPGVKRFSNSVYFYHIRSFSVHLVWSPLIYQFAFQNEVFKYCSIETNQSRSNINSNEQGKKDLQKFHLVVKHVTWQR